MKKLIYIIFICFIISCFSCVKLPQIGNLAGRWRIESIKYPDGKETRRNGRFYSFYRDLAQLDKKIVGIMDYDKPNITLEFKNINPKKLYDWGITLTDKDVDTTHWFQQYNIDHLKGSSLILSTPQGSTITLAKF